MNTPKAKWWGYVRSVCFDFPRMEKQESALDPIERRELEAVRAALAESDPDDLPLIQAYFFQRKTLEDIETLTGIDKAYLRQEAGDFVRLTARFMGLYHPPKNRKE